MLLALLYLLNASKDQLDISGLLLKHALLKKIQEDKEK